MQCSSCQFENMPGSDICGRCGTSLRLATAVIDVHPPRAGPWQKRLRKALSLPLTPTVGRGLGRLQVGRLASAAPLLPGLELVGRLLVPGWPQYHFGRRLLGGLLLAIYMLLLLGSVLTLGGPWSGVLFGLAFAVHSAGIFVTISGDVVAAGVGERMRRAAAISIVLATVLYVPILYGVSRLAQPITLMTDVWPFAAGDVLLTHRIGSPAVGSTVEYELAPLRWELNRGHYYYGYLPGGRTIGRILAGPGSHVLWEHGHLVVNGVPSVLEPLNRTLAPARLELVVPENRFFILPSLTAGPKPPDDAWRTLSIVAPADLYSTIYFQFRPFSKWGPVP